MPERTMNYEPTAYRHDEYRWKDQQTVNNINLYGDLTPNPYEQTIKADPYGIPIVSPLPPRKNWYRIVAIISVTVNVLMIVGFVIYQGLLGVQSHDTPVRVYATSTSASNIIPTV